MFTVKKREWTASIVPSTAFFMEDFSDYISEFKVKARTKRSAIRIVTEAVCAHYRARNQLYIILNVKKAKKKKKNNTSNGGFIWDDLGK